MRLLRRIGGFLQHLGLALALPLVAGFLVFLALAGPIGRIGLGALLLVPIAALVFRDASQLDAGALHLVLVVLRIALLIAFPVGRSLRLLTQRVLRVLLDPVGTLLGGFLRLALLLRSVGLPPARLLGVALGRAVLCGELALQIVSLQLDPAHLRLAQRMSTSRVVLALGRQENVGAARAFCAVAGIDRLPDRGRVGQGLLGQRLGVDTAGRVALVQIDRGLRSQCASA